MITQQQRDYLRRTAEAASAADMDTGSFCDLSMNIQGGWNDRSGLVSFLLEWGGHESDDDDTELDADAEEVERQHEMRKGPL
jgi:hypothetical protein